MNKKPQRETGDFRFSPFDICGWSDFPYGVDIEGMSENVDDDLNRCIGVVRAAIKKAKTF